MTTIMVVRIRERKRERMGDAEEEKRKRRFEGDVWLFMGSVPYFACLGTPFSI